MAPPSNASVNNVSNQMMFEASYVGDGGQPFVSNTGNMMFDQSVDISRIPKGADESMTSWVNPMMQSDKMSAFSKATPGNWDNASLSSKYRHKN